MAVIQTVTRGGINMHRVQIACAHMRPRKRGMGKLLWYCSSSAVGLFRHPTTGGPTTSTSLEVLLGYGSRGRTLVSGLAGSCL